MKRIATFASGFVAVAIPAADFVARKDPEPDMAGLSLLFFGLFGLLAGLGLFFWSASRTHASPSGIRTFCTGVVCAACFYIALGFVPLRLGLTSALGLSFALALIVAWVSPILSRTDA